MVYGLHNDTSHEVGRKVVVSFQIITKGIDLTKRAISAIDAGGTT